MSNAIPADTTFVNAILNADHFANPELSCDLVMKGGITSGVLYPAAVLELAKQYQFRAIGGASAGAIAAAGAAAAECGRSKYGCTLDGQPFVDLDSLSKHMAKPGVLLKLFRPSHSTRILYQLFVDILDGVPKVWRLAHFVLVPALWLFSICLTVSLLIARIREWNDLPEWLSAGTIGGVTTAAGALIAWNGYRVKARKTSMAWHRGWLDRSGRRIMPPYFFAGFAVAIFFFSLFGEARSVWALVSAPVTLAVLFVSTIATGICAIFVYLGGVKSWSRLLAKNRYGVATGHAPNFKYDPSVNPIDLDEPLTDYLFANFNYLARVEAGSVLTFGYLRFGPKGKPADGSPVPGGITLRLMASNLSLQRPYTFPLSERTIFLFKKSEFSELFPEEVVQWMINHQPESLPFAIADAYAKELYYLPSGNDLPLIVAVRISLSHPGLFSAVPLYAVTQSYISRLIEQEKENKVIAGLTGAETDVRATYFSDGGIVSNFPINMFDKWFPSSPTFGINLADSLKKVDKEGKIVDETYLVCPLGRIKERAKPSTNAVHLPQAEEMPVAEWRGINSLADLASAVFYTSKNHRTNAQTELPGYRERIVTIRLTEDEGGLNLNMPTKAVETLVDYGKQAGEQLVKSFMPPGVGFRDHKWIRLRIVLAHLEREIHQMRDALIDPAVPPNLSNSIAQLLSTVPGAGATPFPFLPSSPDWSASATSELKKFLAALHGLFPAGPPFVFDEKPLTITPEGIKRIVPLEGDDTI